MPESLKEFHFSAAKSANIIRQYIEERNTTPLKLSNRTGITYDTIGNILSGKVRDIKFEQLFKICVALAIPLEVYEQLMINGEDIDFADEILLYSPRHDEVIPATDKELSVDSTIIPESVAAVATPTPSPQGGIASVEVDTYSRDELRAMLDRIGQCHEQHMADMRAQVDRQHNLICRLIDRD